MWTRITALFIALIACVALPAAAQSPDAPSLAEQYPEHHRALAEARAQQIEHLRAYRDAGVFPDTRDMGFVGAPTVFLDARGVACAFAYLMVEDGERAQVERIARTNNHLLVGDVEAGTPVMDWILTSGLTHEEAIVVQEPGFRYELEPVDRTQQIRASLDEKLRLLEANTEASLTLALERLVANPTLAAEVRFQSMFDPIAWWLGPQGAQKML